MSAHHAKTLYRRVEVGNAVCIVFFNTLLRKPHDHDPDVDPTKRNMYKATLSEITTLYMPTKMSNRVSHRSR